MTFAVSDADPGAAALFVIGSGRGTTREFGPGCVLRINPVLAVSAVPIDGAGQATIPFPVTAAMVGETRTFQLFVRGPSGPYSGSFTNAIEVVVR